MKNKSAILIIPLAVLLCIFAAAWLFSCGKQENESSSSNMDSEASGEDVTEAAPLVESSEEPTYLNVTDENGSVVTDENGNNVTIAVSTGEAGASNSEDSSGTPPAASIGDTGASPSETQPSAPSDSSSAPTEGSGDIIGTITLPSAK
ncbi:MAG: hypothetical protein IKR26_01365 [Lachnospiraceae bacterium]|nr:hypothetical protein [Lachnospiraceae bacterium]